MEITTGFVLLILIVWLGMFGVAAFVAGVVAIAAVGPRRWGAVVVPTLVTWAVTFAIYVTGRFSMRDWPWLLLAALGTAVATAAVQRIALPRLEASRRTSRWFTVGGLVAGVGLGAIIGGVAGIYGDQPSLALDFAVVGAVLGALLGRSRGRQLEAVAVDPGAPPTMLGSVTDAHPQLTVALDGPASSGKSSVGAAAALELGYRFCDTGLLYRAATWLALRRGISADGDPAALVALVPEIELAPDANGRLAHVTVDGEDVTADVHTPIVDENVSAISRVRELREALLDRQRALAAEPGGIIMAGRDIGTVVLPDADLKLFLDASVEERARRRAEERGLDPGGAEAQAILDQLRRRDDLDRNRAVAPLRPAPDAIHIVTDGNRFEQTVASVVGAIRDAARRAAATPAGRP